MAAQAFHLTQAQVKANNMLGGDALHSMLYGGSRSGKTFVICRAIATRALAAPGSRHAVFRYRFNAIKTSIIADTWPKMMKLCFPDVSYQLDRTDFFAKMPGGSEVWFSGLDDKDRTEKILGQEYASIFLNECSQIPWASRNLSLTRLAQRVDTQLGGQLRLRVYYDCNPPSKSHWTYRVFVERLNPDTRQQYARPEDFNCFQMNPTDNQENLADDYIENVLLQLSTRERKRFYEGAFGDIGEGVLWPEELLDQQRAPEQLPDMQRIVIGVDPSGASGAEDERSDEIGIVVAGLGIDGMAYILEDLTFKAAPEQWGKAVCEAFDRHNADMVVGETNYGGDMVGMVIRATRSGMNGPDIPFKKVTATRGKVVRAEPIAALYESQKVWHAGMFPFLEEQMCAMTMSGYEGDKSPDRLDAMVWALTELFPAVARKKTTAAKPKVVQSRPQVRRSVGGRR